LTPTINIPIPAFLYVSALLNFTSPCFFALFVVFALGRRDLVSRKKENQKASQPWHPSYHLRK